MAKYTREDLVTVRQTIIKLASGQLVKEMYLEGRKVAFQTPTLSDLKQIEAEIIRDLKGGLRRTAYFRTNKGF